MTRGVDVARVGVDELVLRLEHGARAALVVDAEDAAAHLEAPAGRGGGQRAQELDTALAVNDAAGVEPRDAGYGRARRGARVEVDDLLVRVLEGLG